MMNEITFLFWYFLLTIFFNYSMIFVTTGIPFSSAAVSTSSSESVSVISTRESRKTEEIFVQSTTSDTPTDDPVCALSKPKKISLCERIFQLPHYKSIRIYLSKITFFVVTPICEEISVSFATQNRDPIKKRVYSCNGRHDPIRTNFIQDNYFKKFYVSAGPVEDSVIVYGREFDFDSDRYNVYDYIENLKLTELPNTYITLGEVKDEFDRNNEVISNSDDQKEVEYVYIREKYNTTHQKNKDPVCNLENDKKLSLCKLVFDQHIYKYFFWIMLNEVAFHTHDPECTENPLQINFSERYKNEQFPQEMYPCFGRNRAATSDILRDQYLRYFFVSNGPKINSVSVYIRVDSIEGEEKFSLFDLLENVDLENLDPVDIDYEELSDQLFESGMYDEAVRMLVAQIEMMEDQSERLAIEGKRLAAELEKQEKGEQRETGKEELEEKNPEPGK